MIAPRPRTCSDLGVCQCKTAQCQSKNQACAALPIGAAPSARSTPNTTSVQIHRTKPAKLTKGGLHAIPMTNVSGSGKVLISPVAQPAELAARRMSERLELATNTLPVRNSTMRQAYTGAELRGTPARAGACDAFKLPSLSGFTNHKG